MSQDKPLSERARMREALEFYAYEDLTTLNSHVAKAALAEPAQKGQGDALPETGWLVEDEYGKLCIGMECNKIKWVTFTNPDAIRFARKRDAENAITLWKLNGNAREHSWG